MTLQEWCKATDCITTATFPAERAWVSVLTQREWDREESGGWQLWELFHLSDYAVSSRCGIVVYLVPRKLPVETFCVARS